MSFALQVKRLLLGFKRLGNTSLSLVYLYKENYWQVELGTIFTLSLDNKIRDSSLFDVTIESVITGSLPISTSFSTQNTLNGTVSAEFLSNHMLLDRHAQ